MTTYFDTAADEVRGVEAGIAAAVDARFAQAADMMASADDAMRDLVNSSAELSKLSLAVPQPPELAAVVNGEFSFDAHAGSFGSITADPGSVAGPKDYTPGASAATRPAYTSLPSLGSEPGTPPAVTLSGDPGSAPGVTIDTPPDWAAPSMPSKPALAAVTLPAAPAFAFPAPPLLAQLTVGDLVFPDIPEYSGPTPGELALDISTDASAHKTANDHTIAFEGRAAGFYRLLIGMSAEQERALFDRAAATEERVVQREVNEAVAEFSSRGFTMPPGALAKRTDAIRSEGSLRKLAAQREIVAKSMDINAENARHALGQAVDAEAKVATITSERIKRDYDMQLAVLGVGIQRYNALVAVYNANQAMYATHAAIYKAKIDGVSAAIQAMKSKVDVVIAQGQLEEQKSKIYAETVRAEGVKADAFKAQVDAVGAIAQTNEALVRAYAAELQTVTASADAYRARVQGYQAKAEVEKVKIDAFRAQVDAFVAKTQGEKAKVEAYAASVQGYSARANAVQAVAGANLAMAQAYAAEVNADVRKEEIQVAAIEGQTKVAMFKLDAVKAKIMAEGENIRAAATAFEAHARAAEAGAKVEIEGARLELAAQEANMRTAIAVYDTASKNAIADMERMVRAAQLQAESGKVVAQTKATMAAGLMAGVHYSMGVSGQASISGSGSGSYSESHNYEE